MNKTTFALLFSAITVAGCRTPVTPDESWADYGRYYTATGEVPGAPTGAADIQVVQSRRSEAAVESLKAQGNVVLGCFKIEDDTDISRAAVAALAQKLNASAVVWSTQKDLPSSVKSMPNPDMGVAGVNKVQMAGMNADRPDQSFAEQAYEVHHTIWMLGKKAK